MITTGFITRCWKSGWPDAAARFLLGFLITLCALTAAAQPPGAHITHLRVERTEEGVLLSANVLFELPAQVEDALAKGIPMFFLAEATLYRDRWYWYDQRVAAVQRHMRLSYQPLTRRWRLQISPHPIGGTGLALGQTFETREEALSAIQRISQWKIAESSQVDPAARYNVDFRFSLDVSQLPRPFQIGAVGQSEWNIRAERNETLAGFESSR